MTRCGKMGPEQKLIRNGSLLEGGVGFGKSPELLGARLGVKKVS